MTEKARRAMREAVRAGLFQRYRKVTQTERYENRTVARAMFKHPGWARYVG